MATIRRTGCVSESLRPQGTYYTGIILVGGRRHSRCSYDRAVVEAWLDGMLAAHPTYEVDPHRGKARELLCPKPGPAQGRRMTMGERPVPKTNPFAGARRFGVTETPSLWMVVAETNPLTARYHIRVRADWPRPRRVLTYDSLSEAPVAWIADDNGGEGYGGREEARIAALAIEHDPSVMLAVRPLVRRWRDMRDEGPDNVQETRPWQGE